MPLYLVTGIAGFIGSALAHALLERGECVRGIDNFSTGKAANLAAIRSRIELVEADLNDTAAAVEACRGADYVLHQAAIPSVPRSVVDPMESNRANVDGTLSLLIAARDAKVKRVVYASSSSLYGDTPTLPKREDMLPGPISPYAVAKLAGEYYMASFYRVYGLETVSLRYFNVFGPRQDPTSQYSGVLAKFISCMLRGAQPTIYGDGEQSRDFTFIDNVVDANLLACTAPAAQVAGRAFNAATGRRITLNETYALLQKLTGFNDPPEYGSERAGDIKHSLADISRIEMAIGYKPKVMFEEGLRQTVEWYRTQVAAAAR
jgi:UDP-N-acetylglucosamine/UDP-N-acetyl-alpha-D-glucosaminouronate 4-epimerase